MSIPNDIAGAYNAGYLRGIAAARYAVVDAMRNPEYENGYSVLSAIDALTGGAPVGETRFRFPRLTRADIERGPHDPDCQLGMETGRHPNEYGGITIEYSACTCVSDAG